MRRGCFTFLITLFCVVQASLLYSQDTPDKTDVRPYAPHVGSSMETVSLVNGSLVMNVPIWSFHQRGKLKLDFWLSYDSPNFDFYYQCNYLGAPGSNSEAGTSAAMSARPGNASPSMSGTANPEATPDTNPCGPNVYPRCPKGDPLVACFSYWEVSQLALNNDPEAMYPNDGALGVKISSSTDYSIAAVESALTSSNDNPYQQNVFYGYYYNLITPDNGSHRLAMTTLGDFRAIDGTGYQYTEGNCTLRDSEGISYSFGCQTVNGTPGLIPSTLPTSLQKIEDPNGNKITISGGNSGWVDSEGRSIPALNTIQIEGGTGAPSPSCPTGSNSSYAWAIPGVSAPMTVCVAQVSIATNIQWPSIPADQQANGPQATEVTANYPMISGVVTPSGDEWSFSYTPGPGDALYNSAYNYGNLSQITLPTGGSVSYTWGVNNDTCGSTSGTNSRTIRSAVLTRTVAASPSSAGATWKYGFSNGLFNPTPTSTSESNTVTDPLGNYSVHTLGALGNCAYFETGVSVYDSQNNLLKTETTDYQTLPVLPNLPYVPVATNAVLPVAKRTIWPDGVSKTSTYKYDQGYLIDDGTGNNTDIHIPYGNKVSENDYDFGNGVNTGSLLRSETLFYWIDNTTQGPASSPLTWNFLSQLKQVNIVDYGNAAGANGTATVQSTLYGFDESNLVSGNAASSYWDSAPANGSVRGNQTSISKYLNSSNGYLTTNVTYTDTGMIHSIKLPLNTSYPDTTTTYDYSAANQGALLTSKTDALGHSTSYSYYPQLDLLYTVTDPNNATTTYSYYGDTRLQSIVLPPDSQGQHGESDYSYPSTTEVDSITKQNASQSVSHQQFYDGLGRATRSVLLIGCGASGDAVTDKAYDQLDRVLTETNPHCTGGTNPTDGTIIHGQTDTTSGYDALGRPLVITNQDGSQQHWTYIDECTTFIDEVGATTKRCSDALGRLAEVTEAGTPNPVTTYTYDAFGNLGSVNQIGVSGETPRVRGFRYDSLSRLTSSNNPENGSVGYGYDAHGNLLSKTDARGVATTYSYDALNRLISKTYSDGTVGERYGYDGKGADGNPLGQPSLNSIGRLSQQSNFVNIASTFSYDPLGRLSQVTQCIPTDCSYDISTSASYDLAGNMASMTYPDGRTVQNVWDSAGRLSNVNYLSWGTTNVNQPYFSESNGYDPAGHLIAGGFGNSTPTIAAYDNRERMIDLAYGPTTGPLWSKQYAWTPNSNMQSATDLITGVQRQFAYDNLNRLTSAQDFMSSNSSNAGSTATAGTVVCSANVGGTSSTGASPQWTDPDDSNIFTDADEPNDGNWSIGSAIVATNSAVAPDGSMTAMTVSAQNGGGFFAADRVSNPIVVAGNSVTTSVWLKTLIGSSQTVTIYLLQGDVSGFGVLASRNVTVTNSWQPFVLTGVTSSSVNLLYTQIGEGGFDTTGQAFAMWNLTLQDSGTASATETNWLPYSQRFTTSAWNLTNVTAADNTASAPDGTHTAATLTSTSTNGWFIDNVLANPAPLSGVPVTGSVWARSTSGAQNVNLYLIDNGNPIQSQSVTLTADWQRIQVSGPAQNALGFVALQIGAAPPTVVGQTIQVWGAQLEMNPSAGPYVATGATAVGSGTNLTNLLPYSQQLNGPSWQYNNVGLQPATQAAPDGSGTAAQVTIDQALPYGYFTNDVANPSLYDAQTVTGSIYLQSQSGVQSVNLYLVAQNASGTTILGPQVVSLTSAWQRFSLTQQLPTGLTRLYFQISENQPGASFNVWGSQMEIAPMAGPYVPTSALPVIVGKDLTNLLPSSQPMNGGTWYYSGGGPPLGTAQAPDGSNTATVVTAAPGNQVDSGIADSVMNPSLYDGEQVTASVYLKVPNGSLSLNLYLFDNGNVTQMQTVTVTSAWQRFQITSTNPNGLQSQYFQIGGGGSFTNGQVLQVWGPQLVLGSSPGVYQPTNCTSTNPSSGAQGTLVPNGLNQAYAYDSFGNILQNGSFNTTYTANNQMYAYPYDAAGNLLSDRIGNIMTWDAESRLSTVGGAKYLYDGDGNRVEKQGSSVTDTIYFGGRPVARLSGGQWTDLIYGPNGLLAEVPGTQAASPIYRVTDNLGTDVGSLLANGSFVNPIDHSPFGNVISGSTSDPYFLTGKERDTESGLDYFGARYLSSNMGRFMSPDMSDGPDPIAFGDVENPQSLNLYSYVGNNPVNAVDDDGHSTDCGGGGDKSVVCLVTTAIDKIKDFFSGTSVTTSQTITPPATPAPGVPEGAPGTATGGLIQAQNDARANPRFQPNATTTFCNMASCNIGQHAGSNMGPLMTNGIPNLANTDYNNFAHSGSYHQVGRAEAQRLANMGKVVYGVYKEPGHGHIITVRPSNGPYTGSGSPSTGPDDPIINDIGRHIGVYPLSQQPSAGFRSGVIFYAPN